MNNQMEVLVKKISYLHQKIKDIIDERSEDERSEQQIDFLLGEIDQHRTRLLELEIQEQYKEIEDEAVQG